MPSMKRRISEGLGHGATGNEGKRARSSTGGVPSNNIEKKEEQGSGALVSVSLNFAIPPNKQAELMSQFGKYVVGSNGGCSTLGALNGTAPSANAMNGVKNLLVAASRTSLDSSSSSDSDNPQSGQAKMGSTVTVRSQTVAKPTVKAAMKAPASSESSDSDSEGEVADKRKTAVLKVAMKTLKTPLPTKPLARTADSSNSDSDSEVEKPHAKKQGVEVNGTGLKTSKAMAEKSAKGHLKKPASSDSSSDSSSDNDGKAGAKHVMAKPMVTKGLPQKSAGKKGQAVSQSKQSSDSESDSEAEQMPPKMKGKMTVNKPTIVAKSGGKTTADTSDSESSDSDKAQPKPTQQKAGKLPVPEPPSSSSSDTESESKPPTGVIKPNVSSAQKTSATTLKAERSLITGKAARGPSSNSSDSDSEGEEYAAKAAATTGQSPKKALQQKTPDTGKKLSVGATKPVKSAPPTAAAAAKSPSSTSSDSDSAAEDRKTAANKQVAIVKKSSAAVNVPPVSKGQSVSAPTGVAKKHTTSSSSDSSDSDSAHPVVAKSKTLTSSSQASKSAGEHERGKRLSGTIAKPSKAAKASSSSSSSSGDEKVQAKGKSLTSTTKTTPAPAAMIKPSPKGSAKMLSGKKGASSSSSSSSDSEFEAAEMAKTPVGVKITPAATKKSGPPPQANPKSVVAGKTKGPAKSPSSSESSSDGEQAKGKSNVKGVVTTSPQQKPLLNKVNGKKQKEPTSDSSSASEDEHSPAGNRAANASKNEMSPLKGTSQTKQLPKSAPRPGATQPPQTRSRTRSSGSEPDGQAKHDLRNQSQNQRRSEPFRRVTISKEQIDPKFRNNQYQKDNDTGGWGREASDRFSQVKGKNFRHEMTKLKRGSYQGGKIAQNVRSIKFND